MQNSRMSELPWSEDLKKKKNFLMLCKHNINYDFMKTSCVGDIGTVRLRACCITYKPRYALSADINE